MHFVCSRGKMDLIWLGYEPWKITLCVSSVRLTVIVKLVSIMLNSGSNIKNFKNFAQAAHGKDIVLQ